MMKKHSVNNNVKENNQKRNQTLPTKSHQGRKDESKEVTKESVTKAFLNIPRDKLKGKF